MIRVRASNTVPQKTVALCAYVDLQLGSPLKNIMSARKKKRVSCVDASQYHLAESIQEGGSIKMNAILTKTIFFKYKLSRMFSNSTPPPLC